MDEATYEEADMTSTQSLSERDDITCPKTGERIPLDKFSVSKWSDQLYLVHCPACRVLHEFTPAKP
jgi:hypothetical protein